MKAFQLKIAIKNSKPPIWRRVVVPAGITFSQLSMILNKVMGWCGYHMFEFEFYHLELRIIEGAEEFMDCGYGPFDYLEASDTYVREYLEENEWFTYTYDLGDDWQHRVTIEKIISDYEYDYPRVLKYKGDCPVEDCGGIYGYYDCLDVISDKNNPEYEERLKWMESQGYPCEYDIEAVNKELKEQFYYKWGKGDKRKQGDIYEEFFAGQYGLNAAKRDKNENTQIIKSGKHKMEDSFQMMADLFKQYSNWQQDVSKSSLKDIFSDYTKEDIVEIAKVKGLKGISGCNKDNLIDKLVNFMLQPEVMEKYFLCLCDSELEEFEKGAKIGSLFEPENTDALLNLYEAGYIGMLTAGEMMIPKEVVDVYNVLKGKEFDEKRKKISFLFCCLRTSGVLYGIVPFDIFMKIVNVNSDLHLSENEVREEINNIPPEFSDYILVKDKIYHKELYPNDRGILQAQGDKEYYIPSKDEIIDLGTMGYLPNSKELKRFENYLVRRLDAMQDEAEFVGRIIQMKICGDCKMQEIIEVLDDFGLMVESEVLLNQLVRHVNELWNDTRMLLNRGFTPNEMAQLEGPNPLLGLNQTTTTNVVSFEKAKKNKIYPNDPCPCGSGKKYKNCCKNKE